MKYAIVYSSMTGNTAALADKLHDILPEEDCVYFGDTAQYPQDSGADLVFIGFWTDKGSCDDTTRVFLKSLRNTNVVLFGTAGYADPDYIKGILKNAESDIPVSNTVLPGFVCQGRMKQDVLEKFSAILSKDPDNSHINLLMNAYQEGLSHPNADDFEALKTWAEAFIHE